MVKMIKNRKELKFYLMADRMMNRGVFTKSIKDRFLHLFFPDPIMKTLEAMRKSDYYKTNSKMMLGGANYFIYFGCLYIEEDL